MKQKKIVDYSYSQAEYYAIKELEKMKEEGLINDEIIQMIIKNPETVIGSNVPYKINCYKEVLRFIRKNNITTENIKMTEERRGVYGK